MKKIFSIFMATALIATMITSCKPDQDAPQDPQTPTDQPTTPGGYDNTVTLEFPMKHVIEEFTGQTCGYCPSGMDYTFDFVKNRTDMAVIMHHAGYEPDNLTIDASKKIASKFNVNGAPSVCVDRIKAKAGGETKLIFHPANLTSFKTELATTTYGKIEITRSYNASTRELAIDITGEFAKPDVDHLMLSVLVKESGIIAKQADYYGTYEGWAKFCHVDAPRVWLTAALGDTVYRNCNNYYQAHFTTTLKDAWNADNCMIMAMLYENNKTLVNAEWTPVVEGTQGGADIQHGGVEAVPVSDAYPEPENGYGPADYMGTDTIQLIAGQMFYSSYSNFGGMTLWTLYLMNANTSVTVGGSASVPFANIQFIFPSSVTSAIPDGTYVFSNIDIENGSADQVMNKAWAGVRDDSRFSIEGSKFMLTNKNYFNQGYLVPSAQWLISAGSTITINGNNIELNGVARNGKPINATFTGTITNYGRQLPRRMQEAGAPAECPVGNPFLK